MKQNSLFHTRNLVLIGMLSALSAVLMLFDIPLPFAPSFYKVDISEVPVLIGAFAISPWAGILIEFLKNLINLMFTGTTTVYIGELANFISGVAFVIPAALIYHHKKTKKSALLGLIIATIVMSVFSCFVNAFLTLPAYIRFSTGLTMDGILGMGAAVNPLVSNLFTFLVFTVLPFNLMKCAIASLLTMLLYKRVAPIIKRQV